jgi:adenylylsulfate kinase
LFVDAGVVTLASFVSPYIKDREAVKNTLGKDNYIEVFVNTSLSECEKRDVKGLYKKARTGEIPNMTGISAPYESPLQADIEIDTEVESLSDSVNKILNFLDNRLYG